MGRSVRGAAALSVGGMVQEAGGGLAVTVTERTDGSTDRNAAVTPVSPPLPSADAAAGASTFGAAASSVPPGGATSGMTVGRPASAFSGAVMAPTMLRTGSGFVPVGDGDGAGAAPVTLLQPVPPARLRPFSASKRADEATAGGVAPVASAPPLVAAAGMQAPAPAEATTTVAPFPPLSSRSLARLSTFRARMAALASPLPGSALALVSDGVASADGPSGAPAPALVPTPPPGDVGAKPRRRPSLAVITGGTANISVTGNSLIAATVGPWTGDGVRLKPAVAYTKPTPVFRSPSAIAATGNVLAPAPPAVVPISALAAGLHAGSQAPVAASEAEMVLGTLLGTLHVGESFGERALVTAWGMANDAARTAHIRAAMQGPVPPPDASLLSGTRGGGDGRTVISGVSGGGGGGGGPAKRTKDQPGLWREVTVVAAEDTTLLCLHKSAFVSVMQALHAHIEQEVADFLARIPLLACCTRLELSLLAKYAVQRRCVSGTCIVAQGQRMEGLYVVRAGRCNVQTKQQVGWERGGGEGCWVHASCVTRRSRRHILPPLRPSRLSPQRLELHFRHTVNHALPPPTAERQAWNDPFPAAALAVVAPQGGSRQQRSDRLAPPQRVGSAQRRPRHPGRRLQC
jgi:hypothetical protein